MSPYWMAPHACASSERQRQRSVSHIKEALGAADLEEEREEEERHDGDENVVEAQPPHEDRVELTDSPVWRSASATRSQGRRR